MESCVHGPGATIGRRLTCRAGGSPVLALVTNKPAEVMRIDSLDPAHAVRALLSPDSA